MDNTELRRHAAMGLRSEINRLTGLLREVEGAPREPKPANGEPAAPTRKRRRKMSAAARAQISARMKEYWAGRAKKAAKGKRG